MIFATIFSWMRDRFCSIRGVGAIGICLLPLFGAACNGHLAPATQPTLTTKPVDTTVALATVDAVCVPPAGWSPEPLKENPEHRHQLWISPGGNTAYGVLYMALPLPGLTPRMVLRYGFLPNMKENENGKADLIGEPVDDPKGGIRFTVEGGYNLIRVYMVTDGWKAWAVYAGTDVKEPINEAELKLAEQARDHTTIGLKH